MFALWSCILTSFCNSILIEKESFNCVQAMEYDEISILLQNLNINQIITCFFKKADDPLSSLVLMVFSY